ncbi:MAG: DUF4164 family protein [Robiginitomaculum sp.]|nr:DUF4164 family protein [Robiginitomaculum sp.]
MTQSSSHTPSSSREAADRLVRALSSLEQSLEPMIARMSELEKGSEDSKTFEQDRARLASDLDDAQAREKNYKDREAEMSALAHETTAEMDSVISQVLHILGET